MIFIRLNNTDWLAIYPEGNDFDFDLLVSPPGTGTVIFDSILYNGNNKYRFFAADYDNYKYSNFRYVEGTKEMKKLTCSYLRAVNLENTILDEDQIKLINKGLSI